MFRAGDILIGPYPPGSGKRRRFLVLSDEIDESDPRVAWVYVSTSMSDLTCALAGGCHPDITQECSVICAEAGVAKVSDLRAAVVGGALNLSTTPLGPDLVGRAQEGAFQSEDTPLRVADFCTDRI